MYTGIKALCIRTHIWLNKNTHIGIYLLIKRNKKKKKMCATKFAVTWTWPWLIFYLNVKDLVSVCAAHNA